jgi:hypothetical protein
MLFTRIANLVCQAECASGAALSRLCKPINARLADGLAWPSVANLADARALKNGRRAKAQESLAKLGKRHALNILLSTCQKHRALKGLPL